MSPRQLRPWLAALVTGLLSLALAGCGASASTQPTVTSPPTAEATATPVPAPVGVPTREPPATARPESCSDPYPQGAPYMPEPGQPVHLSPTGTPAPLPYYNAIPLVADPALEAIIRQSLGADIGHYGIVVKRLDDGRGAAINAGNAYYAASLYKIWAMLEAFHQQSQGLLSFDEQYVVSDYYASLSLNPDELAACEIVTAEQTLQAMMSVSDNVAGNMILERVGTTNTNSMLHQMGLMVSGLQAGGDVYTTANGTELVLEAIARGQAVSAAASEEMISLLASETIDGRIPALLPPGTRVAHKTGSWSTATNDAGIVFSPKASYVIVVLSDFGYEVDAGSEIASLSRAVYDYFNPE
jgi:beta-lactamase class A